MKPTREECARSTAAAPLPDAPIVDRNIGNHIDDLAAITKALDAADAFLFWFNLDNSPCDGFRFREQKVILDAALPAARQALQRQQWMPIERAPRDGLVFDVLLRSERNGYVTVCAGHWAHGHGDGLMPSFGPSWFRWNGSCFVEVDPKPTHWMPMPSAPQPPAPATTPAAEPIVHIEWTENDTICGIPFVGEKYVATADGATCHKCLKRFATAASPAPATKLSYEERSKYACHICGNVPDEEGAIDHGRGCYTQSEDGGGTSFVEFEPAGGRVRQNSGEAKQGGGQPPRDPRLSSDPDWEELCKEEAHLRDRAEAELAALREQNAGLRAALYDSQICLEDALSVLVRKEKRDPLMTPQADIVAGIAEAQT